MPLADEFWQEPPPTPRFFRWVQSLLTPNDTVALGKLPCVAHVVGCRRDPPQKRVLDDRYLVGDRATAEWEGHDWEFASWHESGSWIFVEAIPGCACIVDHSKRVFIYTRTNRE